MRTVSLDPDFRRKPKTSRFCCCCQRDIKTTTKARIVRIGEWPLVIHPDDADDGIDAYLIGPECSHTIPLEYSFPE